ncbi:MAG TPA: DUF642 domain-containing protein [Acetobacteraceae bacterium]
MGIALGAPSSARAGSLLTNGSFENLNNTFVNQSNGCMAVYADDSTTIPDWTVSHGVTSDIAWCNGPAAFYPAADGDYWIDLTGFGTDSPNGAIRQTISVTPGDSYTVDFMWGNLSNGDPGVDIDGVPVALNTPTGVGDPYYFIQGTFIAGSDPTPYLEFYNATPGAAAMIIDAGSLTLTDDTGGGGSIGVAEPASLALLCSGIAGAAMLRRMRRSRRV